MMKENTIKVLNYLKSIGDEQVTSNDVAEAVGLTRKQVDGIFTAALSNKGYGTRVPAVIELEDGSHKNIKFLTLTDAGRAVDPNAEDA